MAAVPRPDHAGSSSGRRGSTPAASGVQAPARSRSSIVLVAAITLAFGWGTDYDFTTSGLIPTACVTCALAIGLLRAAYESVTAELQRLLHVRRRVLLVGDGITSRVAGAGADVAAARAGVRPRRLVRARARRPAGSASRAGAAGRDRPQRGRLRRGDGARARRDGAPDGRERADRAEDDRAAAAARRVRARAGRAAVRAAAARARRRRLGGQARLRPRRQPCRRARSACRSGS